MRELEGAADVPVTYVAVPYEGGGGAAAASGQDNPDHWDDDISVSSMASTVTARSVSTHERLASAALPDRNFQWTWSISCNGFDPTQNCKSWLWDRRRAQRQKYPADRGDMLRELCQKGGQGNAELIEQILDAEASDVPDLLQRLTARTGEHAAQHPRHTIRPRRDDRADADQVTDQLQSLDIGGNHDAAPTTKIAAGNVNLRKAHTDEELEELDLRPRKPKK